MKNINDRVRLLIQNVTNEHRRFKELEELTGISTATWKTFWSRGSNPSAQMIEEICQKFPKYAFWLTTGLTDPIAGHIGIKTASDEFEQQEFLGTWSNFPLKYTEEYFKEIRKLMTLMTERYEQEIYQTEWITEDEKSTLRYIEEMRFKEIERQIQFAQEVHTDYENNDIEEDLANIKNLPNFIPKNKQKTDKR